MLNNSRNIENDFVKYNNQIIDQYIKGTNQLDKKNKQSSYRFNPLTFFSIGETMQSFLIAKLLDPNGEHGQKNLFLKEFLSQIGIDDNEKQKWIVTAEKGRIDILIKGSKPHSVIIIENKSHNARDQSHQLYRYWYDHMFLPYENKPSRYALDDTKKFRLIYLARDNNKIPSSNTLMKPESLTNENLPPKLNESDVKVLTFQTDITGWLTKCLKPLKANHRLYEYVKQYVELCKSY